MRNAITLLSLVAGSALAAPPDAIDPAVRSHSYRQQYKHRVIGTGMLTPVVGGATVKEIVNSPKEWHRGITGFGKRLGSSFGTNIIKVSIETVVAAARHEDLHYYRSEDTHFGPRLRHALVSTVVTHKTTNGHRTAASGRISGAIGAGLISTSWYPMGFSFGGGMASGGISLGATAGVNVAREFWPRRKPKVKENEAPGAPIPAEPDEAH